MWGPEAAARFGDAVRALRKEARLSQEELAQQVGITKKQLQLIEVGRSASDRGAGPSNPRMTTLDEIAGAFNLSVAELLSKSNL